MQLKLVIHCHWLIIFSCYFPSYFVDCTLFHLGMHFDNKVARRFDKRHLGCCRITLLIRNRRLVMCLVERSLGRYVGVCRWGVVPHRFVGRDHRYVGTVGRFEWWSGKRYGVLNRTIVSQKAEGSERCLLPMNVHRCYGSNTLKWVHVYRVLWPRKHIDPPDVAPCFVTSKQEKYYTWTACILWLGRIKMILQTCFTKGTVAKIFASVQKRVVQYTTIQTHSKNLWCLSMIGNAFVKASPFIMELPKTCTILWHSTSCTESRR